MEVRGAAGAACSGTWKWERQGPASGRASPVRASSRSSVPRSPAAVRVRVWCRKRGSAKAARASRTSGRCGCSACRAADSWDLTTGTAGPGEVVQGGAGFFEGGGEVAGVDADADAVVADRGERGDGVAGGLDDAARFGFEGDADGASGELLERVEAFGQGAQRGAGGLGALVVVGGAPGERQGGDAALGDVVGEQSGEHAGEGGGVLQAFGVGPVGFVDAVLDLLGAEALVGEAVEGDDLEAAPLQFAAEVTEGGGVGDEGAGGVLGQPQADAEPVPAETPHGRARSGRGAGRGRRRGSRRGGRWCSRRGGRWTRRGGGSAWLTPPWRRRCPVPVRLWAGRAGWSCPRGWPRGRPRRG